MQKIEPKLIYQFVFSLNFGGGEQKKGEINPIELIRSIRPNSHFHIAKPNNLKNIIFRLKPTFFVQKICETLS